jgi:hypothetical protein
MSTSISIHPPSTSFGLNWFHEQIVAANNEIDGLETSLARVERQLERAELSLIQRDTQIVSLKREQTQTAARHHREVERLTQHSRRLERELADKKDYIQKIELEKAIEDDLARLVKEIEAEIVLSAAEEKMAMLSNSTMNKAGPGGSPVSVPPLRLSKCSKLPISRSNASSARSHSSTTPRAVCTSHGLLTVPGKTTKKPTMSSKLAENQSTPVLHDALKPTTCAPQSKRLEKQRAVLVNCGQPQHSSHTPVKAVTPLKVMKQQRLASCPPAPVYHAVKLSCTQIR